MFIQLNCRRWVPTASIEDVRDHGTSVEVRRTSGEILTLCGEDAERVLDQVTGRPRPAKASEKSEKGKAAPVIEPVVVMPATDDSQPTTDPAETAPVDETPAEARPKPKRSRKAKRAQAEAPAAE